jgi:hypothetical protein
MGSFGNDDPVARGILILRFCCRFSFWFLPVGSLTGSHLCDASDGRGEHGRFPRLFHQITTMSAKAMAKRPLHEIRRGLIVVRIWRKRSRKHSGYSTSVVRLFRNGVDWKESSRFDAKDIPLIRLALDDAFVWMLANQESKNS